MFSDTIAAISTPRGKGGVAVIRISGENAFEIAEKFIFPKSKKRFAEIDANRVFLADVKNAEGKLLDESLITIFRAPRSYTGENVVEISCHGGVLLTQNILSAAFSAGAVQAGPGEFTRRAFSAGKLSLTEAEAVIGMIDAKTNAALMLAQRGISGTLKKKTEKLYRDIGKHFKTLDNWQIYVITSHERFEKLYGRRADKVRKLYNGMIPCYYYQFFRKDTKK